MNDDNDGVVKCQKNPTTPPRCHSDQVDPLVIVIAAIVIGMCVHVFMVNEYILGISSVCTETFKSHLYPFKPHRASIGV